MFYTSNTLLICNTIIYTYFRYNTYNVYILTLNLLSEEYETKPQEEKLCKYLIPVCENAIILHLKSPKHENFSEECRNGEIRLLK